MTHKELKTVGKRKSYYVNVAPSQILRRWLARIVKSRSYDRATVFMAGLANLNRPTTAAYSYTDQNVEHARGGALSGHRAVCISVIDTRYIVVYTLFRLCAEP